MKKRKEEILNNKKQSTVQSTEQSSVQSTVQSSVQSTEQYSVQSTEQYSVQSSTVQLNGAYIHDIGMLFVLTIGVYVFFTYNKKAAKVIHEEPIEPKRRHML